MKLNCLKIVSIIVYLLASFPNHILEKNKLYFTNLLILSVKYILVYLIIVILLAKFTVYILYLLVILYLTYIVIFALYSYIVGTIKRVIYKCKEDCNQC